MSIIEFTELVRSCCSGFLYIPRMQTAFLFCCIFPPPAPFALVLPGQHGLRARLAPDAHESLFMKFVIWDIIFPDVIPDLF